MINVDENTTCVYSGEWKASKKDGFGHLKIGESFDYVGEFKDDHFSGRGLMRLLN